MRYARQLKEVQEGALQRQASTFSPEVIFRLRSFSGIASPAESWPGPPAYLPDLALPPLAFLGAFTRSLGAADSRICRSRSEAVTALS